MYRVAYEIQENKVIPVLLYGTHNNFYELAENTRNFIRVDESALVELSLAISINRPTYVKSIYNKNTYLNGC